MGGAPPPLGGGIQWGGTNGPMGGDTSPRHGGGQGLNGGGQTFNGGGIPPSPPLAITLRTITCLTTGLGWLACTQDTQVQKRETNVMIPNAVNLAPHIPNSAGTRVMVPSCLNLKTSDAKLLIIETIQRGTVTRTLLEQLLAIHLGNCYFKQQFTWPPSRQARQGVQ